MVGLTINARTYNLNQLQKRAALAFDMLMMLEKKSDFGNKKLL